MSDVTPVAPATPTTTPVDAGMADQAAPNMNMSGKEALAWVESQKSAQSKSGPSKTTGENADPIKEAAAEAKRKLKIGDEEVDEEEVFKIYKDRKGHQQAANKILQEGKLARKQAEEFLTMMRDPDKFFEVAEKLGHQPRTLAEKKLAAELELELMDPREKEFRAMQKKLAAIEDMEKQQKEAEAKKVHEALKSKYHQEYQQQFTEALQAHELPAVAETVADMAKYVQRATKLGFKMTPDEAAQLVKEDLQRRTRSVISKADGEMLLKLLGPEVANKIRTWDTSRVKTPEQFLRTPTEQADPSSVKPRGTPKKRMTPQEWREFNRR